METSSGPISGSLNLSVVKTKRKGMWKTIRSPKKVTSDTPNIHVEWVEGQINEKDPGIVSIDVDKTVIKLNSDYCEWRRFIKGKGKTVINSRKRKYSVGVAVGLYIAEYNLKTSDEECPSDTWWLKQRIATAKAVISSIAKDIETTEKMLED